MFEVILFDLGNVVVELGESPLPKSWFKNRDDMSLPVWVSSEIGRQFEKGMIPADEFASQLKQEFELDKSIEEIKEAFSAWLIGLYPSMPDILTQLRADYHLAVLSNTNDIHFPRLINELDITEYFDTIFVSHHMHKAKPELAAFQHAIDVLNVQPEKILFLDDNEENIAAARTLGIHGIQVCGEDEVKLALVVNGIL